ncbi:hybrid sensor histidine kinase/response regulator [Brunnivagina elsteri]|uniref:histidine kinase n=1 Tax=Brunnivagina elsteri CCALA 953 TaxID=987040 RepID=A0A2A2TE71_9CYAN|nr:response regulator [Calothrix elsteri]PAX52050.1 hybrid sensor histidine kinase/response regulator [Calothrix elsteri CCALA 953]
MTKYFFEKAKILIVDDNQNNLKVLCDAIADSGWEILVSLDGESAVEQAEYAQPDLILLDVMMSGMDGFETCEKLKFNLITREIPIIFMTALSDTIDKVKGLSIGGVDYITKPFHTEEVLARINIHLKLYSLAKQLEEQKIELEQRVAERTKELTQAVEDLKQSQLQLVQSEKMSTLGQLVASVAHEINNPVGFIMGNLSHLAEYTSKLINHLQMYRQLYPEANEEINKNAQQIYLNDLMKETPEIISSTEVGIERIFNISTSLKNFSRSDTSSKIEFDIHEGINSTLMILKHRLKANKKYPPIEIIKEYGDLPLVNCYPGQINQVFMNIIANAIDALEESVTNAEINQKNHHNLNITITTIVEYDNNCVKILIQDNGLGMDTETQEQIFDKFFTTKAVGKGTGLGLSISRQIIEEKHQGKIYCNSVLGKGMEFVVEIPINTL